MSLAPLNPPSPLNSTSSHISTDPLSHLVPVSPLSESSLAGSIPAESLPQVPGASLETLDSADLVGLASGGLHHIREQSMKAEDLPGEIPFDLQRATSRQLRRWSNTLYRALDKDFPPYGATDDFDRVNAEIQRREPVAPDTPTLSLSRDMVRDNTMNQRFEFFRDGMLAGYVDYTMRGGTLRLHRTVIRAFFEGAGIEGPLAHKVILAAHKRRLAPLPYCPILQAFLRDNPQYRQLIHTR